MIDICWRRTSTCISSCIGATSDNSLLCSMVKTCYELDRVCVTERMKFEVSWPIRIYLLSIHEINFYLDLFEKLYFLYPPVRLRLNWNQHKLSDPTLWLTLSSILHSLLLSLDPSLSSSNLPSNYQRLILNPSPFSVFYVWIWSIWK
jgi:hypothetical protein